MVEIQELPDEFTVGEVDVGRTVRGGSAAFLSIGGSSNADELTVGEVDVGRTVRGGSAAFCAIGGSHYAGASGASSSLPKTYLEALLTGMFANSDASKGTAVFDRILPSTSTSIDKHVLSYVEEEPEMEEPEMEEPLAADADVILPLPVAAPGDIMLPVAADANEAEHVDHDAVRVNENAVPWLPTTGSLRKVRKWSQARKGVMVMTNEGLGYFVYGTYGPNGLEF